ncbi:BamA/TamA family outer membrane protein [Gracilimonas mengyeensis]|uniref:Surface antigen n=1 Tax=Gracilimonas mengyeensis TaxID=1302730 RepID=A0A521EA14_9BACT|nr:BamA/TamA family outer membrane protein [Gracilimonas mengyeensis]SMO80763.1 Surface antigen [Gracilimonas mengyeensis]
MDRFLSLNDVKYTVYLLVNFRTLFSSCLLLCISTSICTESADAQIVSPQNTVTVSDSVEYAFLPALAYNSDLGLIGGGIASRYHYKRGVNPFYSYINVNAIASTKGLLSFQLLHDKPQIMDSRLRSTTELYVSRFMENQYYGVGSYQEIEEEPEANPDYYYYKSFSAGFELTLRNPLFYNKETGAQIDIYGLAGFSYRTPWGNPDDRLISEQRPVGIGGSHISELGLGMIWENRNSEFSPTTGTYAKAGFAAGHKLLGSDYDYIMLEGEARTYLSFFLIREITFANKISYTHTSGDLPYWKLSELGGSNTLRGYPENRFLDDNALLLNSELRTWLIEFPEYDIRFGGTLFTDIGRTFHNGAALQSVFNDLRYTFGFGGVSSFFTDDFIMRADIGFSQEGYGIYFTSGFQF